MGRGFPSKDFEFDFKDFDFQAFFKLNDNINVDGLDIFVISKDDLIINKRASGREQDAADAAKLEKHIFAMKLKTKGFKKV